MRIYKTNTGIFLISNQLDYILHVNIYIYIYIAYVIGQTAHSCPNCVLNDKTDYLPTVVQKQKKKLVNYYVNVVNGRNLIS